MQDQLSAEYRSFFESAVPPQGLEKRLSNPLLISIGPRWMACTPRVLFVGQETLRWSECKLADFVASGYPIQKAIDQYENFGFAKCSHRNRNSPFWRAFRLLREQINQDGKGDILWTNLFKCDLDGGAVVKKSTSKEALAEILKFQHGLLTKEVLVLRPTAVLFFTGPRYDCALRSEFIDARLRPVDGHREQELVRIDHPKLPPATFRTYHPNYLNFSKERWSWLCDIARKLISYGPAAF